MKLLCFPALLAVSIFLCSAVLSSAVGQSPPIGMDALTSLDHLPLERTGIVCLQHSSYDRTGGNDDGFSGRYTHIRRNEQGEYVIFDAEGPGCIYRLWSAMPPEGYVKFFFDDEPKPRLECIFQEMFQDKVPPFASPLTGQSSGGWYSYYPIPFQKRCTIVTQNQTGFLAIAYHSYPKGTQVGTFTVNPSPALIAKTQKVQAHFADPAKAEYAAAMEMKWQKIPSGPSENVLFAADGPGTIRGIHMKIKTAETEKYQDDPTLRKTVLRIYWDGDTQPAVECPVGDFFGTGFGDKQPGPDNTSIPLTYSAVPFGMTEQFYYFRLPMPFRKSARVTIENGNSGEIELGWALDIDKSPVPENALYFHAQWRNHMTKEGEHVPILDTKGKGHYVGTVLSMQSPWWLSYLEGDEKFYVDGETQPSIHGTGTEDYFNCGWYYATGPVAKPFHGLTVKREPDARTSQYRMHVPDCVPFTKSLKVEIEHGESNNKPYTNYAIVAYWYQDSTSHVRSWKLPPASELRLPGRVLNDLEGEWVSFNSLRGTLDTAVGLRAGGEVTAFVPLHQLDENFDGPDRFLVSSGGPGAWAKFEINTPRNDIYNLQLMAMRGPQYGIAEVFVDGKPTELKVDLYSDTFNQAHVAFDKPIAMTKGTHWIELRITGKNENSKGFGMALAGYLITGASPWPKEWNIVGAFSGGPDNGYGAQYPPETSVDLRAKYRGAEDKDVSWVIMKTNSVLWLHERIRPNTDCVAYAHTYVWSPDDRRADALVSTDDGGKLFINSEMVWGLPGINHLQIDEFAVPIKLIKGWNEVLIKVCQNGGHWGFAFRILDPNCDLIYSPSRELPEGKAE